EQISSNAVRQELECLVPARPIVARDLGAPAKAARLDVAEDPAQVCAVRARPFLEDAVTVGTADEIRAVTRRRIDPCDAPRITSRVVDAQRRTVLIRERSPGLRCPRARTAAWPRDPHVLDCAPSQNPAEMTLPAMVSRRSIRQEGFPFCFPAGDDLPVERELLREIRRGLGCAQRGQECVSVVGHCSPLTTRKSQRCRAADEGNAGSEQCSACPEATHRRHTASTLLPSGSTRNAA